MLILPMMEGMVMHHKVKIYYHQTDCGGVVYYARYLEFLEEARTEYFATLGISVKEMMDQGRLFVVARQEIDYRVPAVYGDTLEITSRITKVSGVRLTFTYEIKKSTGEIVATAKSILASIDDSGKPSRIPEDICKKIPS